MTNDSVNFDIIECISIYIWQVMIYRNYIAYFSHCKKYQTNVCQFLSMKIKIHFVEHLGNIVNNVTHKLRYKYDL